MCEKCFWWLVANELTHKSKKMTYIKRSIWFIIISFEKLISMYLIPNINVWQNQKAIFLIDLIENKTMHLFDPKPRAYSKQDLGLPLNHKIYHCLIAHKNYVCPISLPSHFFPSSFYLIKFQNSPFKIPDLSQLSQDFSLELVWNLFRFVFYSKV